MIDTLVIQDEDYREILDAIERLARHVRAKGVFLIEKNGQLIADAGEMYGLDTTSLASLAAGNVAATAGLAKLIGEDDFPTHFHQGQHDHLHMTVIGGRFILLVVFDDRTSLGLVRLRVRKSSGQLAQIFEDVLKRADGGAGALDEITEADIDKLFSD